MKTRCVFFALVFVMGLALPAGCSAPAAPTQDPALSKAAAESTAIVRSAQATAMVQKAQATANALVGGGGEQATPLPQAASPTPAAALISSQSTPVRVAASASSTPTGSPPGSTSGQVELIGVTMGAEGSLVVVEFRASPKVVGRWMQGTMYVVDEATGTTYDKIPEMPIIGPLFTRPNQEGQLGNVMLYNMAPGLQPGSRVTVVLGDYRQEHVIIK